MCLQCSHIFLDELILGFYFLRLGDNIAHKRLTGLYIFTRRLGDVGKCVCDRHGIGNDVLNPSGHGSLFLNACDCALHAYGNVGRNVARIAKGVGMEIYAFDAFCPKEVIEKDGVKAVASAEELYSTCDVVSLHIPATAETKNSINYALVNKMPKGGLLVNTARKEVINEAELIQLMEERADLKYMTDIMPAANETFAAKFAGRYFSTPKKMGAQTAEANINAGIAAAKQIVGFLKDGCEKFRVNK